MKVLHTSDWHLGKLLSTYSRLEEQALFIDELEEICKKEEIDLIIIAGDIYDTFSPPIEAEKLFYSAMKRLSLNGKRPIIIISGNHDSPKRLLSPTPIMDEFSVFIKSDLETITPRGTYKNCKVTRSGEAFIELEINNEKVVILTVPYITEKIFNINTNTNIINSLDELTKQQEFSNKVKIFLNKLAENFSDDTINILMMHLFVIKGVETDSERNIQIGGAYAVDPNIFPNKTQYVALGHLHKPQKVSSANNCMAYYSGSPIAYSRKEANREKCVIVLDIKANNGDVNNSDANSKEENLKIKKIPLKDYKPIHLIKSESVDDAINQIKHLDINNSGDGYIYLDIFTNSNIYNSDLMEIIASTKKDVVDIIINSKEDSLDDADRTNSIIREDKSIVEHFKDFYKKKKNIEPYEELINKFEEILNKNGVNIK